MSADDTRADRFATRRADPRGFAQAYVHEGRGGRPLLLLHGWPETKRIWWRNVASLADAGFEVIAPDLRGFGESEAGPGGVADTPVHSRDLYALVRGHLGHERVLVAGGDAGGAVAQDLSLRFPGFVERMALFNCPLPYLKGEMDGLATRPPVEAGDYFLRQGTDADALAAELRTPEERRRYVATFYTSRFWGRPGGFTREAVDFMTEPFADAATLRATFRIYEAAFREDARSEPALIRRNPTPTLVLFGAADHVIHPDFDAMAARVFPNHVGPLRVPDAGHFLQWEAAGVFDGALRHLLRDDPRPATPEERAFVGLGSNLGFREGALAGAVAALRATRGVRDVVVSPVYETDPVGPGEQGPYLNAALRLDTTLAPEALLARLLEIERDAGRRRTGVRNEARELDLDLLLFGDRRLDTPELRVPHPRMLERPFVLEPLAALSPGLVHPTARERVADLAARVRDPSAVRRRDTD
ncbi:MAG: 2-amino-4-hydroxy-6-hydroxymethyldihydropteridine diphosphokinase [Myxococcota bacterium]